VKCAGCNEERIKLRVWKNGKKYCLNCYEEITAMSTEEKNKRN
jgi:formylmethanofuran dehydrogenase subunit E